MTILCVDFMNQAHRARSGFSMGSAPVVYNFFRQFRSLVEKFEPNRIYVVLEGHPTARHQLFSEYKATRRVEENDPKYAELQKFFEQTNVIVNLLKCFFPVSVIRHPTSECDDTIYNLLKKSSSAVPWTVVSNDTDFIQLIQEFSHVKVWNPIKKQFLEAPEDYDYVTWKSLRGDSSDNIPGIPGIGDKTAADIASDPHRLYEVFSDPEKASQFQRNHDLISFRKWNDDETFEMESSSPTKNWDAVKNVFDSYGFQSITNEGSWHKFTSTFEKLWR